MVPVRRLMEPPPQVFSTRLRSSAHAECEPSKMQASMWPRLPKIMCNEPPSFSEMQSANEQPWHLSSVPATEIAPPD
eukprot:4855272-Prymnesium_polylepis.3